MSFYCEYHGCMLEDVSEHQQKQCFGQGMRCEECMRRADEEGAG